MFKTNTILQNVLVTMLLAWSVYWFANDLSSLENQAGHLQWGFPSQPQFFYARTQDFA